jgi:signal transduction histidine kinase
MAAATDVWGALGGNPVRFLMSSWPWRSLGYLASGAIVGVLTLVGFFALVGVGLVTAVVVVGFFLLGAVPLLGVAVGGLERRRLALMRVGVPDSVWETTPRASLRERVRAARREPASWRELGYAVLLALLLWWVDAAVAFNAVVLPGLLVLSPVLAAFDRVDVLFWQFDRPVEALPLALVGGPVLLVVAAYLVTLVAAGQASLARILLSPSEAALAARVRQLGESRVRLVDAFETERRRIERDLHDGVQQRLVALTMTLGSAELEAPEGPTLELVQRAHQQAEEALTELRATVRGIHPRVLVDHGLVAAVNEVADRSPVPVRVDIDLPGRLDGPVEAAAYFVVSEALTNVARHARATHAAVAGGVRDGRLVLTVVDDGGGGASVTRGTGLAGLVTRLEALDGTLSVTSPSGGPTEVRMESPCRIDT